MLLFIIGFLSGTIGAMGIGGGTILIPFLVFLVGTEQHTAQNINLISFIPVAVIALIIHIKNNNIRLKHTPVLILTGIAGAIIGSNMAIALSSKLLTKLFGIFLFVMGIYEITYNKQ